MTILDIAQAMRGKLRDGYSAPQAGGAALTSELSYGTAQADSAGGFVDILMDNMPAGGNPADYTFSVACDSPISQGDRVAYITIDGVGKAVSTATVANMAQNANAIASATNQYFFHDSNGAHVATVPDDPDSGRNVTLNSYGLLFRDGTTDLAEFSPTEIKLGENCTLANTDGATGTVQLAIMNLAFMQMKRGQRYDKNTGTFTLFPILALGATGGYVDIERLNVDTLTVTNLYPLGQNFMQWEQIYYNASYAPVTFTLDKDIAEFNFVDFLFTDGTRQYIQRAPVDHGLYSNTVNVSLTRTVSNSSGMYIGSVTVDINGASASWSNCGQSYITSGGASYTANTNNLRIIGVYGIV